MIKSIYVQGQYAEQVHAHLEKILASQAKKPETLKGYVRELSALIESHTERIPDADPS